MWILCLGRRCNSVGELHQEKHPVEKSVSNQNVAPLLWSREQQKQLNSIKMAVPYIFVVASSTLKKFFIPYLEQNSITDRNLGESYVTFGRCANNVSWTFNKANREQNISRWRGDNVRLGTDIINIHKLQSYSRMFWFVLARQLQILSQHFCLLSDNPNSCSLVTELIIIIIADTLTHKQAKLNDLNLLSSAGKSKTSILLLNSCQNTKIMNYFYDKFNTIWELRIYSLDQRKVAMKRCFNDLIGHSPVDALISTV